MVFTRAISRRANLWAKIRCGFWPRSRTCLSQMCFVVHDTHRFQHSSSSGIARKGDELKPISSSTGADQSSATPSSTIPSTPTFVNCMEVAQSLSPGEFQGELKDIEPLREIYPTKKEAREIKKVSRAKTPREMERLSLLQSFSKAREAYGNRDHTGHKTGLHRPELAIDLLRIANALQRHQQSGTKDGNQGDSLLSEQSMTQLVGWDRIFCLSKLDLNQPVNFTVDRWKNVIILARRDQFMLAYIKKLSSEYHAGRSMFRMDQLRLLADATNVPWYLPLSEAREAYEIWRYHYKEWLKEQQEPDEESADWLAKEEKREFSTKITRPPGEVSRSLTRFKKTYQKWKSGKISSFPAGKEVEALMGMEPGLSLERIFRKHYEGTIVARRKTWKLQALEHDKILMKELGLKPTSRTMRPVREDRLGVMIRLKARNVVMKENIRKDEEEKNRVSD